MALTSMPLTFSALTVIEGEPEYTSLQVLQRKVNSAAISVLSSGGDGIHGHLNLTISDVEYLIVSHGTPWVKPGNPGAAPIHIPGAIVAARKETNRQFLITVADYRLCNRVLEPLKTLLMAAVNSNYIAELEDPAYSFGNVLIRNILDHLRTSHGTIDASNVEANFTKLDLPVNFDEPLKILWRRVIDAQCFAANGQEPISEATTVRNTPSVLKKIGLLDDAYRDWHKHTEVSRTWANLHTNFTKAATRIASMTSRLPPLVFPMRCRMTKPCAAWKTSLLLLQLSKLQPQSTPMPSPPRPMQSSWQPREWATLSSRA
jgi:hypothetical protein